MTEQTEVEAGSRYIDAMDEILALVKGRVPVIWVITHEENRFIADFRKRIATPYKRQMWIWSGYQGLVRAQGQMGIQKAAGEEDGTHVAAKALERIAQMPKAKGEEKGICYIMRDMQIVLTEQVVRQMRDMFEHMIGHGKTIIIVSPVMAHGAGGAKAGIPPTMEKQISVVHYELPDADGIKTRVQDIVSQMKSSVKDKKIKLKYTDDEMNGFAKALRGLTLFEVDNAVSTSMTHLKHMHVRKLVNEKRQIIARSDILEFIDTDVNLDHVGGLDRFKEYIQRYINAQSDEAKAFGVEPLKGIVLSGVPGTGKSLSSKAMGNLFRQPLLRLDVGRVMTGLVGGSEGKMRDVIKMVKSMVPCILWIDEVEKSLSGTKSSNFSDGGTLSRVFGTLLHAMEEELEGCTIIATSNDISALPPEFIRRFNDVFFVDLPGPDERWEIFSIHLGKRGRDISKFNKHKQEILTASDNYTGAEIEKAIKDAIAAAFHAGHKDVNHKDILAALKDTKPISKVMKTKIDKIREKARGHYRYASSWAEQENQGRKMKLKSGKSIDLNEALDDLPEMVKTKKEKNKAEIDDRGDRFSDIAAEE